MCTSSEQRVLRMGSRNMEEGALLWRLSEQGALPGGRALFLDDLEARCAREVAELGLLSEVRPSCFMLTKEGMNILVPATETIPVSDLCSYVRPHVSDDAKSLLELLIDLQKSGWQQLSASSIKHKKKSFVNSAPTAGSSQPFYVSEKQLPFRSYLLCLKSFRVLQDRGLACLYHCQLETCLGCHCGAMVWQGGRLGSV